MIHIKVLDMMWIIIICIKNESLIEIKTSLEKLWQRTIRLSDLFSNAHWCSFPTGRVWMEVTKSAAGSVVLLQLSSIHDGAL